MSKNMRYKKRSKKKNYLPIAIPVTLLAVVTFVYVFFYQADIDLFSNDNSSASNISDDYSDDSLSQDTSADLDADEEEYSDDEVVDIPEEDEEIVVVSYPLEYEVTESFDVYVIPLSTARVVETSEVGDVITISSLTRNEMEGVDTPDMLKVTTADGIIGFIEPSFIDETVLEELCELDGFISCTATTEEDAFNVFDEAYTDLSLDEKIALLKEWYPQNRNWNTVGLDTDDMDQDYAVSLITDTACNHSSTSQCQCYNGLTLDEFSFSYNIQCLAFASMVSDFLFGKDTEITTIYDMDEIQVGDHIRLTGATHSMIVTEVTEDGFRVVEVNSDYNSCRIKWDRYISKTELSSYSFKVLSRY
ncbi:MAG: hypothetical protein R3Y35_03770 [Clostridia bacterium]